MTDRSHVVDQFIKNGKKLIPKNGKRPLEAGWQNKTYSRDDIVNHAGNIAWALGSNDLVIDIDPRHSGLASFKKLLNAFSLDIEPSIHTPNDGGFHIYLSIPTEYIGHKLKATHKDYPGIDFLSKGKSCTIPSSDRYSFYKGTNAPFEQTIAPEGLIEALIKTPPKSKSKSSSIRGKVSIEYLKHGLKLLDSNMPNDQWIAVGIALKDWDNELGLILWEEWSKNGNTYRLNETNTRWDSFDEASTMKDHQGITIKTLCYLIEKAKERGSVDLDKKTWANDWGYIHDKNIYVNLITHAEHKAASFNIAVGKHIPPQFNGSKLNASKHVADTGILQNIDTSAYAPHKQSPIYEHNEQTIWNTFDPKSVPKECQKYTAKGLKAARIVENHIDYLFDNKEQADIFKQWLAHQIQYPGRKIQWAPLIQSIQGIGKSFFAELLRACLGRGNVGNISPKGATSDFTGWSTGVIVNILDELRIIGHNRHDFSNAVKQLITDPIIQVNEKHINQYMTENVTNYACFTNHRDAIYIDDADRRWWVVFLRFQHRQELADAVGINLDTYFEILFNTLTEQAPALRKWLVEYPILDEFLNLTSAPTSMDKQAMIDTESATIEGLREIEAIINEGGRYWCEKVVSRSDLFNQFLTEYPELNILPRQKNSILTKLGYLSIGAHKTIKGKSRSIWRKHEISNKDAVSILKKISGDESITESNQNEPNPIPF